MILGQLGKQKKFGMWFIKASNKNLLYVLAAIFIKKSF